MAPSTVHRRLVLTVAAVAAAVAVPATASAEGTKALPGTWVGSWTASVARAGEGGSGSAREGFTDTTVRQVAHLSVGGESIRIRISNAYGSSPLEVRSVTVAPPSDAGSPAVDVSRLKQVTFNGNRAARIPAGAEWVSDPVVMPVEDDSDVVVSMYLPGPTGPATWHLTGYSRTFTAAGDATRGGGGDYEYLDTSRYYLEAVDVAAKSAGSVVFFGDSITDGMISKIDGNMRFPDQVFDRIADRPDYRQCGILNAGLTGNRLLTDAGRFGDSAMARFDRDVLAQTGAHTVVMFEGINDIGNSQGDVEPEQLIAVYRQFIERAHDAGLTVLGGTLTPFEGAFYYTEAGERDRRAVNEWIRTSGAFDGVIDFDRAIRDPERPSRIKPQYDPGDHLHPNDAGFTAMAAEVELREICS